MAQKVSVHPELQFYRYHFIYINIKCLSFLKSF